MLGFSTLIGPSFVSLYQARFSSSVCLLLLTIRPAVPILQGAIALPFFKRFILALVVTWFPSCACCGGLPVPQLLDHIVIHLFDW
jgi:hypothetical protein